jgi:hypothetical protein
VGDPYFPSLALWLTSEFAGLRGFLAQVQRNEVIGIHLTTDRNALIYPGGMKNTSSPALPLTLKRMPVS